MEKLTLRDWAQVADIFASVGVVISLIFVATSIERSNSLTSAGISDDTYDALRAARELALQDRALLALTQKTLDELEALDGDDRALYREWVILYVDEWERLYSRERDGLIRRENMVGWNDYFRHWFRRHVSPDIWTDIRWRSTSKGFRELLDEEMALATRPEGHGPEAESP